MTNRAVRRQQLKDDPKSEKSTRAAGRKAMPSMSTSARTSQPARGGLLGWRPRLLMDVVSELRKVIWPKREDVTHLTFVIVVVTILIGAVLGLIDISFSWLIDKAILSKTII
jgi:preprotein translocase, SecE subunit, bacterial